MIYHCCSENRKKAVLGNPLVNGIDYLEVLDSEAVALGSPRQRTLLLHCINPLAAHGWSAGNVVISGGERITGITADWVEPALPGADSPPQPGQASATEQYYFGNLPDAPNVVVVRTHVAGDFSPYVLRLVNSAAQAADDPFRVTETLDGFDPQLAEIQFSFKVECPPFFDCAAQPEVCPPAAVVTPQINYLAKDYSTFRTLMVDRLNQLVPTWGGTSEADLGLALAELVSYAGDRLSYQQDAVATEAYLETARRRISLRRHALLVDYRVSDGSNARAWIQLQVYNDNVFIDHTLTRFYTAAPGMPASLAVGKGTEEAAIAAGVQVFQPMQDATLYVEQNQISFYTWGDTGCCLAAGATEATLRGSLTSLMPGDVLIFQEMIGPQTGSPADADLRHRCAVRLTQVATLDGRGQPLQDGLFDPANPVPLTEVQWSADDALPFPLCLSSSYINSAGDTVLATDVSVAFGNVVLADHGVALSGTPLGTVAASRLNWPADPAADHCDPQEPLPIPVRFRPVVPDSPVTQAVPLPLAGNPVTGGVVALTAAGFTSLSDANGFVSLMVRADQPANWPQLFGVRVRASGGQFDLAVVFSPPGGAPGVGSPVVLEQFLGLSLQPADLAATAARVTAQSRLIAVAPPATAPAAAPTGFGTAATFMLSNSGSVEVTDPASGGSTYLSLLPTPPAAWPKFFGVLTQGIQADPPEFNLVVVYAPSSGGVGVNLPVTVELFPNLSLANEAEVSVAAGSQLVTVWTFSAVPNPSLSAYELMNFDAREAVPVIDLVGTLNGESTAWTLPASSTGPLTDLLESGESDPVFVVEVEGDGSAHLRFGDDTNGQRPASGTAFTASYRIGNGTEGNVGADSLVLFASPAPLKSCRNPLPAVGGTDPETTDQIRRRAPQAFMTQERAVIMTDYQSVTEANPLVEQAAAHLRWTGSWFTVFVAVEPQGAGRLVPSLKKSLKKSVGAYRLAGQDLDFDAPQYVSLALELSVCVDPAYFQADVEQALLRVLSSGILPSGQPGIFYPDNFTFGQTVYLSPIYAAARSVAGVVSVQATVFQPQGGPTTSIYIEAGEIELGPLQIARLDNNPDFPDHGQLTLDMEGGK